MARGCRTSGTDHLTDTEIETEAGSNLIEVTVTELAFALKKTLENTYGRVRVRGEVLELARPRSGHIYFKLKDEKASIDAVCWKGVQSRLRYPPEEGMEVIATGKITSYPPRSTYQIIIENIEPAGEGALLAQLDKLRRKLAAEGLFDDERKQDLPYLPEVIGVVTSASGAVFRDILHRLRERFPRRVLLWPVLVQGKGAAEQIAAAIEGFNALAQDGAIPRPDLLIVGRGGGSLEDLWAFNEEVVVRATAASDIPLISAVGHETDTTLIDFASDLRAPTPTAAAEFAVPVREELLETVAEWQRRLVGGQARMLTDRRTALRSAARGLRDPRDLLNVAQQRFDDAGGRLKRALRHGLDRKRHLLEQAGGGARLARALSMDISRHRDAFADPAARLHPCLVMGGLNEASGRLARLGLALRPAALRRFESLGSQLDASARLLEGLSYQNVLMRGFALIRDNAGLPVKDAGGTLPGMDLVLEFHDGSVAAKVLDGPSDPRLAGPRPAPPKAKKPKSTPTKPPGAGATRSNTKDGGNQGNLF